MGSVLTDPRAICRNCSLRSFLGRTVWSLLGCPALGPKKIPQSSLGKIHGPLEGPIISQDAAFPHLPGSQAQRCHMTLPCLRPPYFHHPWLQNPDGSNVTFQNVIPWLCIDPACSWRVCGGDRGSSCLSLCFDGPRLQRTFLEAPLMFLVLTKGPFFSRRFWPRA